MFGKCCLGPHSTPEDVKSAKTNEIPGWWMMQIWTILASFVLWVVYMEVVRDGEASRVVLNGSETFYFVIEKFWLGYFLF